MENRAIELNFSMEHLHEIYETNGIRRFLEPKYIKETGWLFVGATLLFIAAILYWQNTGRFPYFVMFISLLVLTVNGISILGKYYNFRKRKKLVDGYFRKNMAYKKHSLRLEQNSIGILQDDTEIWYRFAELVSVESEPLYLRLRFSSMEQILLPCKSMSAEDFSFCQSFLLDKVKNQVSDDHLIRSRDAHLSAESESLRGLEL